MHEILRYPKMLHKLTSVKFVCKQYLCMYVMLRVILECYEICAVFCYVIQKKSFTEGDKLGLVLWACMEGKTK